MNGIKPGGEATDKALLVWLEKQSQHFSAELNGLTFLAAVQFMVQLLGFYLLAGIVSRFITLKVQPTLQEIGILAVVFSVQLLVVALRYRQQLRLSRKVLEHFHQRLNQALENQSLALIRDYSVASWQSFFLKRLPAVQQYFCDYLPQRRLSVGIPLVVLLVCFPISWLVTLLLVISAPLVPLFMWIVGSGAAVVHRQHFHALERLSSLFLDRLRARQLLQLHRRVGAEERLFTEASGDLKARTLKVVRVAFLSSSVLDFFSTLALALVAVFVGFSLLGLIGFGNWQTGIALHDGLFVLLLAPLFFSELKTLGRFYHLRAEAVGAAHGLKPVIETPSPRFQIAEDGGLNLSGFEVLANSGKSLVRAESIRLEPGDRVLLQGPSGAGKSIFLEGLIGLRQVKANSELRLLDRRNIGWLPQNPIVLPGSIRENLCLGKVFSERRILKALETVALNSWLAQQENGLDTLMGDYPPLSGGQKQRLAIARLLLFDKPIVFLDEPGAHLSDAQANHIHSILETVFVDKTIVWVSHDLAESPFFNRRWWIAEDNTLVETECGGQLCA